MLHFPPLCVLSLVGKETRWGLFSVHKRALDSSSPVTVFPRFAHRLHALSQFAHAARTLVRGGPTRPHRPRLVASHSTRPPSSPPLPAHSFYIGPAVINIHTYLLPLARGSLSATVRIQANTQHSLHPSTRHPSRCAAPRAREGGGGREQRIVARLAHTYDAPMHAVSQHNHNV